jgi:hypothetical protein
MNGRHLSTKKTVTFKKGDNRRKGQSIQYDGTDQQEYEYQSIISLRTEQNESKLSKSSNKKSTKKKRKQKSVCENVPKSMSNPNSTNPTPNALKTGNAAKKRGLLSDIKEKVGKFNIMPGN